LYWRILVWTTNDNQLWRHSLGVNMRMAKTDVKYFTWCCDFVMNICAFLSCHLTMLFYYDIIYSNISYFACMSYVFICVCVMLCLYRGRRRNRFERWEIRSLLFCCVLSCVDQLQSVSHQWFESKRRFHVKTMKCIDGILCYEHTDCAIGEWFVKINRRMKTLEKRCIIRKDSDWVYLGVNWLRW
jgi:hypothetical protein